eukprot:CAMPEP_0184490782 /NCGR_PEP_ID=MMETSP0113_2-20130426/18836_1 /TAXON_ID=91329 /ORGANISM="Norrisiella sphaerica, Strain BC52" /LENGTH=203 /DNA_ID=CAMNT_0026874855 /DNA_START=141 /DNA_END=749 /DNA_ORIENTATION=+
MAAGKDESEPSSLPASLPDAKSDRSSGFKGHAFYLKKVVSLARENVVTNNGHPFACLVVNNETGEILSEAPNLLAQTGDPTAHAEMVAIREASPKLRERKDSADGKNGGPGEDYKSHNFYIITSPCPMCASAMAFCGPDTIVHVTTRKKWAHWYPDVRRYIKVEDFISPSQQICSKLPLVQDSLLEEAALDVFKLWNKRQQQK